MITHWKESPCPRCGRFMRHDINRCPGLCSICLMREADRVDRVEQKKQALYDWPKTLLNIKRRYHLRHKDLALRLKISPQLISDVKKGRRAFPAHAFDFIKENYSECLVENTQA